jgi:flagellar hook-associated protein FlgK
MSSILSIALTGLNDAKTRVANAASNMVNAASTNFSPQNVISQSNSVGADNLGVTTKLAPSTQTGVDIPTQLINLKEAQNNYSADALLIKIDEKTKRALLDIKT